MAIAVNLWLLHRRAPPEEALELIPSITFRTQLNELERFNIAQARGWAMREANRARADIATDSFARELHRRMFSSVWKWKTRRRYRDAVRAADQNDIAPLLAFSES